MKRKMLRILLFILAATLFTASVAWAEDLRPELALPPDIPPPTAPEDAELAAPPVPAPSPMADNPTPADELPLADSETAPLPDDAAAGAESPQDSAEAQLEEVAPVEGPSQEAETSARFTGFDRVPLYQLHRPEWGVELAGSLQGFGKEAQIAGDVSDLKVRGVGFQFDYQPRFLQAIGVIGLGPSFGAYPVTPASDTYAAATAHWYVGGQVRYQARFFREQILVPMIGYAFEYMSYRYKAVHAPGGDLPGESGRLLLQGPVFGAWLLLNWFEPSAAADMFVNNGVSRSYLVAEMRMLQGADINVDVPGEALFFGLRIEY
jgi:hypothetical protein